MPRKDESLWYRQYLNGPDHLEVHRLSARLGVSRLIAFGHLHWFLSRTGSVSGAWIDDDPALIAGLGEWTGDGVAFRDALLYAGVLEERDGRYWVEALADVQKIYDDKARERERVRLAVQKTRERQRSGNGSGNGGVTPKTVLHEPSNRENGVTPPLHIVTVTGSNGYTEREIQTKRESNSSPERDVTASSETTGSDTHPSGALRNAAQGEGKSVKPSKSRKPRQTAWTGDEISVGITTDEAVARYAETGNAYALFIHYVNDRAKLGYETNNIDGKAVNDAAKKGKDIRLMALAYVDMAKGKMGSWLQMNLDAPTMLRKFNAWKAWRADHGGTGSEGRRLVDIVAAGSQLVADDATLQADGTYAVADRYAKHRASSDAIIQAELARIRASEAGRECPDAGGAGEESAGGAASRDDRGTDQPAGSAPGGSRAPRTWTPDGEGGGA